MIPQLFIDMALFLARMFVSILPTGGTLPTEISSGLATIWALMKSYDFILPITAIVACATIATAWVGFLFFWRVIHWVMRKIPWLSIH